jgi:hypothetical protein
MAHSPFAGPDLRRKHTPCVPQRQPGEKNAAGVAAKYLETIYLDIKYLFRYNNDVTAVGYRTE